MPAFVKLLKDTEAEVRSAIAGQIPGEQGLYFMGSWHATDARQVSAPFSSVKLFSTM